MKTIGLRRRGSLCTLKGVVMKNPSPNLENGFHYGIQDSYLDFRCTLRENRDVILLERQVSLLFLQHLVKPQ